MEPRQTFGIAETDNYVRKILGRAGELPIGDLDALHAALVPLVMEQESGGDPRAVSRVGAVGTMQTMPATLRDPGFGVTPARDDSDAERERVGKDYLKAMLARYPGRPDLALAAYNAGPGRADRWAKLTSDAPMAPSARETLFRDDAGLEATTSLAEAWEGLPEASEATEGANFLSNVVGLDSGIAAVHRLFQDAGAEFDPNFNISQLSDEEWKLATEGIPEEYQVGLASAASRSHLQTLSTRLRMQVQAEQELAGYGGWGVAGRFAASMLDPVAVAISVGTGGIGTGTNFVRLANAARVARAAGKLDEASAAVRVLEGIARQSKGAQALRLGAVAAAENAGFEALVTNGDPTRGGWDVAQAALVGGLLGAGASRVFGGRELRRVQSAYLREKSALELDELNFKLDTQKAEINAKLMELDAARASLSDDPDVAHYRGELDKLSVALREAATARRQELTTTAAGALKRSELGKLRRDTEALRKQARKAEDLPTEVEIRMAEEDAASLGPEVASSKQRTKMRQKAAKAEAASRQETIRGNLARAETALGRATAAEDARRELRKFERLEAKNDPLLLLDEPGRNRFAERELELTDKLGKALGVQSARVADLDAKKAGLQARLEGIETARVAGVQASDRALMAEADSMNNESLSAMRFTGFNEGAHPELDKDGLPLSGLPSMSKTALAQAQRLGPMSTLTGILRGSPNAEVRRLLGRLVGNSAGNADKSVNVIGASEHHARIHESMTARFNTAVGPAYKEWAEKQGIGMLGQSARTARTAFMAEVGEHIRGSKTSEDPSVLKAAAKVRPIFKDYLTQAKEAGVKGFEEVEPNDNYLPRVFDFKKAYDIEDDIGSDNFRTLVAKAVQSANEDVPDKLAMKLATAYVDRMKNLRVGSDAHLLQGVKWDDVGFLRRFLGEAGIGSEETEDIVGQFAALNLERNRQLANKEGSFRYAKKRVQMDESFSMKFRSQRAAREGRIEDVEIRLSDLFENNVEALFGRYSRTVSGHIGLAKVGFKSRDDLFGDTGAIKQVERALADDLDELDRVRSAADLAYKVITGQPVQDATALTRWGRALRDYNFATTMNQVGFSQFPDLAGLVGKGYLGHTLRHFFDGFAMMRRTDGTLDDEFANEMESVIGLGSDYHNNAVFSSYDPGEENGFKGAFGTAEHGLRVGGRVTQAISGMASITAYSQRLAGRVIVQRLVKDVLEGGALNAHRSATLGLDGPMKARIAEQLKAHTKFVDGDFGGKVRIVNYTAWTDVEARDAMMYAVFREARRLVQEEDLGDTTQWMHQNWGKVLAQFRRFALVSYSKQLLHGIAHADAEEGVRVMLSMVMAAAAYKARHELRLASLEVGGAEESELEEYRERYLSNDRLFAAAYANSSYSSLMPALLDTVSTHTIGERFFNTRSSGLGSDLISGNPTISALNNLGFAAKGVMESALRGDRQYDKGDARALRKVLPFQNVYGMDALFAALTDDLPEDDEDTNDEELQWFFE